MNPKSSLSSLIAAPLLALATVVAPSPLPAQSAQPVQHHILFYDRDFAPSNDGLIEYNIFAAVEVQKGADVNMHHVEVHRVRDHAWHSPRGLFFQRAITPQDAVDRGAPKSAVSDALNTPNAVSVVFYEASYFYDDAPGAPTFPTAEAHRAKGTVELNVAVPDHPGNRWWLHATSAIGERKGVALDLAPGRHTITIIGIEAGNVLVGLTAVDADGGRTSYFQEGYALVRKNVVQSLSNPTAVMDMEFAEKNAADRYRIAHLGAGNSSQGAGSKSGDTGLPLEEGHEAMVRVRIFDAWGNGGNGGNGGYGDSGAVPGMDQKITVAWTSTGGSGSKTFTSRASGRHVDSGLLFRLDELDPGRNEHVGLGPKIPAEHVRPPHIDLTATLWGADGQAVDTRTARMDVAGTRELTIRGYDFQYGQEGVWPYVWEDGWEYANNSEHMLSLLAFAEDTFSYSDIKKYVYGGKLALSSTPTSLTPLLYKVNEWQGDQPTDVDAKFEDLHMGLTTFNAGNTVGVAMPGGKRAFVVRVDSGDYPIARAIAHEMGHCFGLLHAPSPGVDANNYLDTAFPYGGAGLAGGWGYSTLTDTFYGENDHVLRKAGLVYGFLQFYVYHDVMSYTGFKSGFSDHNAMKLKPNLRNEDQNAAPASAPSFAEKPGVRLYPGTRTFVYGPEAALARGTLDPDDAQAQAWLAGQHDASAFYKDEAIQSLLASTATPPSVIFTVIPKFDDVEIVD